MTRDRIDQQVAEMLHAARPQLADGWQGRAEAAMHQAYWTKPPSRWAWAPRLAGVAVVLLALGVLPLSVRDTRGLRRLQTGPSLMSLAAAGTSEMEPSRTRPLNNSATEVLDAYRKDAVRFVQYHAPHDPELLMAAGLLAADKRAGLELLRAAAHESGRPAAWAAYVDRLMLLGPTYRRPGNVRVTPGSTNVEARVAQMNARDHLRDRLTEEEARPLLVAVREWQRAEPDNAYPLLLEVRYLYGLHRDDEARTRWVEAAGRPTASSHRREVARAVARQVVAMGARRIDVFQSAMAVAQPRGFEYAQEAGRIAAYEGKQAQSHGRARDAVAWWKAAADVGHRMQVSGDEDLDFMIGYLVERVGVQPSWVRPPDGKMHYYHGPAHALFVRELGANADAEMRDRFIRTEMVVHRLLLRGDEPVRHDPLFTLQLLYAASQTAAVLLAVLAVVWLFVAAGARSRGEGAPVVSMSSARRRVLMVAAVAPIPLASAAMWALLGRGHLQLLASGVVIAGVALAFALPLLLPLSAVWRCREGGRGAAWRGTLRQTLPGVLVLCAALSLGLFLGGRCAEYRAIRRLASTGTTEAGWFVRAADRNWASRPVPAGSWSDTAPPAARR